MKRYIYTAIIASALLVGAISGCSKEEELLSPKFEDGTQLASTDGGETWFRKSAECSCQCGTNAAGVYPGTCNFRGNDISCQEWCSDKR